MRIMSSVERLPGPPALPPPPGVGKVAPFFSGQFAFSMGAPPQAYEPAPPHRYGAGNKHSSSGQGAWFPQGRGPFKKRGHGGGKKGSGAGGAGDPPSLHQLQTENRMKTRKHYRGHAHAKGQTPRWSVPRAPEHNASYLFPTPNARASPSAMGFHSVTPAASFASAERGYWRNGLGSIDQEAAEIGAAAGIDMFGSNAGLIMRADDGDVELAEEHADDSDSDDDPYGFELQGEEEDIDPSTLPASVRQRMDEQSAYICQLEETNLKLQERIWMLEEAATKKMRKDSSAGAGSSEHAQELAADRSEAADGTDTAAEDAGHSCGSAGGHLDDEADDGAGAAAAMSGDG